MTDPPSLPTPPSVGGDHDIFISYSRRDQTNSLQSVVCQEELEHAIAHGKRLVPIVWQDVDPSQVTPIAAPAKPANHDPQILIPRGSPAVCIF